VPTGRARANALHGCLVRLAGSHSLWAFARWSEACRALGSRRLLQLTHEVLVDYAREMDEATRLGGRMRVLALVVLTR